MLAVIGALLIVNSMALGGVFGSGVQQTAEKNQVVGESEAVVPVLAVGAVAGMAVSEYYLEDDSVNPDEDVTRTDALEDKQQMLDLHAAVTTSDAQADGTITVLNNFAPDSKTVAGLKAKSRMIELINNGTTNASYIRSQINETVTEYYAVREVNLFEQYRAELLQANYAVGAAQNDSGIPHDFVWVSNPGTGSTDFQSWVDDPLTQNTTSLFNGTNVTLPHLRLKLDSGSYNKYGITGREFGDYPAFVGSKMQVRSVTDKNWSADKNVSARHIVEVADYKQVWQGLKDNMTAVKHRYSITYINTVLDGYQSGEIDTTDLTSPSMLAQEWSTKYNNTSAATYRWASLAALGLDSPDLQNTSHLTLDYRKPMDVRHVTFNTTGVSTAYSVEVHIGATGETYKLANGSSGETWSPRVPVPEGSTVTLTGDDTNQTISITDGNTVSYGGVQVEVRDPSQFDRVTESGMLFARDAPSTGFVVGETYDADTRTMFFVPAGQNTSTVKLGGNVTIVGAEDRQGNELNAVDVVDYNYQTTNVSALEEQLTQLEELRKEIEELQVTAAGGSSGGNSNMLIVGLVLVAVAAAASRNSSGGGGRRR
jgi:hypothetical protein